MSALSLSNAREKKAEALTLASKAYAEFTVSTAKYPTDIAQLAGNVSAGLLYTAIGLANEVGEVAELFDREALTDANRSERYGKAWKELGDVQWYAARICDEMPELPSFQSYVQRAYKSIIDNPSELRLSGYDVQSGLCAAAGLVLGVVKKMMRDGSTWNETKRAAKLDEMRFHLQALVNVSVEFAERTGPLVGFEGGYAKLLDANVRKLGSRLERGTLQGDGDQR